MDALGYTVKDTLLEIPYTKGAVVIPRPYKLPTKLGRHKPRPDGYWDYFSIDAYMVNLAKEYNGAIEQAAGKKRVTLRDLVLMRAAVTGMLERAAAIGAAYGYALANGKPWPPIELIWGPWAHQDPQGR